MTPISIKEFVKQTVKNNPGMKAAELTASCKAVLKDKQSGASCMIGEMDAVRTMNLQRRCTYEKDLLRIP